MADPGFLDGGGGSLAGAPSQMAQPPVDGNYKNRRSLSKIGGARHLDPPLVIGYPRVMCPNRIQLCVGFVVSVLHNSTTIPGNHDVVRRPWLFWCVRNRNLPRFPVRSGPSEYQVNQILVQLCLA